LSSFFDEKLKKKMNIQPQNGVVLVKFILILQFFISLNYTPDWLKNFEFCSILPLKNFNFSTRFQRLFILVLGFRFFNLTPN